MSVYTITCLDTIDLRLINNRFPHVLYYMLCVGIECVCFECFFNVYVHVVCVYLMCMLPMCVLFHIHIMLHTAYMFMFMCMIVRVPHIM